MKIQLFTKYTYLYTKRGIIQTVLTKVSISATIYIHKISTFWHLSNSPQLETLFVLKQCQINQRIKSNKPKNCESTSLEKPKTNVWLNIKTYKQVKYLPLYYNDNM